MISNNAQAAIESAWLSRARAQDLKPGSMKYRKAEIEFFAGVMATLNAIFPNDNESSMSESIPPIWFLNAMSGRPIVPLK